MATVLPFRGIVYSNALSGALARVATPPYDVISEPEQAAFYDAHPFNMIRLILGKIHADDDDSNNRYTRAAATYAAWRADRVLVQDERDTFYVTRTDFLMDGRAVSRLGFIARIRLEPFEKGIVLPHEKTFSKVKSDRLALMKACHVNFSPIFALYPDPDDLHGWLRGETENRTPDMDFTDSLGHRQALWRIDAPEQVRTITEGLAEKTIYIADGHHRYETALAYRQWLSESLTGFSERHPANYVMMSLTSMADPGMVILPAHRLLKEVDGAAVNRLFESLDAYFDVTIMPFDGNPTSGIVDAFNAARQSSQSDHVIGMFARSRDALYLLRLKPHVMSRLFGSEMPESLLNLDVTVLTRLILMDLLGFDQSRLDNEKLIGYVTDPAGAIAQVQSDGFDLAFILNPTRIEQVQAVAREGLIMPRKSTYFYPKVITGQVINPLHE